MEKGERGAPAPHGANKRCKKNKTGDNVYVYEATATSEKETFIT